jgi:hypothetical protein
MEGALRATGVAPLAEPERDRYLTSIDIEEADNSFAIKPDNSIC